MVVGSSRRAVGRPRSRRRALAVVPARSGPVTGRSRRGVLAPNPRFGGSVRSVCIPETWVTRGRGQDVHVDGGWCRSFHDAVRGLRPFEQGGERDGSMIAGIGPFILIGALQPVGLSGSVPQGVGPLHPAARLLWLPISQSRENPVRECVLTTDSRWLCPSVPADESGVVTIAGNDALGYVVMGPTGVLIS